MASVKKFTEQAVVNQLRHIERTIANPENNDIIPDKQNLNYSLAPDRGISSYEYFKQRKSELYCYNRDDVKVLVGWIVTAPKELSAEQYKSFFKNVHNFLSERYGEKIVSNPSFIMMKVDNHIYIFASFLLFPIKSMVVRKYVPME